MNRGRKTVKTIMLLIGVGFALSAALAANERIAELNVRRAAESLPTTHMYLGLHIGEVFFGNIGSKDRLEFTVVGGPPSTRPAGSPPCAAPSTAMS